MDVFDSMDQPQPAQRIGAGTHAAGAAMVVLALAWGAGLLRLQQRRLAGDMPAER